MPITLAIVENTLEQTRREGAKRGTAVIQVRDADVDKAVTLGMVSSKEP